MTAPYTFTLDTTAPSVSVAVATQTYSTQPRRDHLAQVPDASDRAGLMAVTQILAGLAFPDNRFLDLFGGADAMIDSPVLDEVKALIHTRAVRATIRATLEARFSSVPAERVAALDKVTDEARLKELVRLAATCADLDAFVAGLAAKP